MTRDQQSPSRRRLCCHVLAGVLCLAGGLGCGGPRGRATLAPEQLAPPLPGVQRSAVSSQQSARATHRVDAASAVIAPPAPRTGTLIWNGSTNGVACEISYRESLRHPPTVYGWVTNANQCRVPLTGAQGFYSITKMQDLDNTINVWVGK